MLLARFLAESELLIEPGSGVPISLEECRELAREEGVDWLALASDYAERMLPRIFRKDSPVLALSLPPETRSRFEELLKDLPRDVFAADDSLGGVYQFWQADSKDAVNRSEKKIGADELPAVTQSSPRAIWSSSFCTTRWAPGGPARLWPPIRNSRLRQEPRMSFGRPAGLAVSSGTYLRFVRNKAEDHSEGPWSPAAGAFEGWPTAAKDIRVLDPCMGSGHFLVFALPILVAFRMAEEKLVETLAVKEVCGTTCPASKSTPAAPDRGLRPRFSPLGVGSDFIRCRRSTSPAPVFPLV